MKTFKSNEQGEFHLNCGGIVAIGLRYNKETNELELLGAMDGYGNSIVNKVEEME